MQTAKPENGICKKRIKRAGACVNPTIGILMCADKDETVVKYSVLNNSQQIFASKYLPYLPSEEDLRRELENAGRLKEE